MSYPICSLGRRFDKYYANSTCVFRGLRTTRILEHHRGSRGGGLRLYAGDAILILPHVSRSIWKYRPQFPTVVRLPSLDTVWIAAGRQDLPATERRTGRVRFHPSGGRVAGSVTYAGIQSGLYGEDAMSVLFELQSLIVSHSLRCKLSILALYI